MTFVAVCLVMALVVVVCQFRFAKRERAIATATWDELLAQVQHLNVHSLQEIADCYLHPDQFQLRIQPGQMWDAVGGFAGVQKLGVNSYAMLSLAMYAERWNDANGRVLSEIMRRDAVRIRSAVQHIEVAMLTRHNLIYLGLELQEAISSYCLLRARLLGMYAECHAGLLPRLEAAL